jgi:hypothetical protein
VLWKNRGYWNQRKGVANMKTIKNLLSVAVFAIGAFKTVCVVDGCFCLKSEDGGWKLELRVGDKEADEKPLPPHWAIVTPSGSL